MRRVEDDVTLVGGRRTEHAKERQLCALVRERRIVATVDHQYGFGEPRGEVDLIEPRERGRLLEHAAVEKDNGFESILQRREHHAIRAALTHTQIGNPILVDVVSRLEVIDRSADVLPPVNEHGPL